MSDEKKRPRSANLVGGYSILMGLFALFPYIKGIEEYNLFFFISVILSISFFVIGYFIYKGSKKSLNTFLILGGLIFVLNIYLTFAKDQVQLFIPTLILLVFLDYARNLRKDKFFLK